MRLIVLTVAALLTGCASATAKPYFELGATYRIDDHSDWYVGSDRDWTCDSPGFDAEFGYDFGKWGSLGYRHQSYWLCGGPFNSKPELYQDDIRWSMRWGGHK